MSDNVGGCFYKPNVLQLFVELERIAGMKERGNTKEKLSVLNVFFF